MLGVGRDLGESLLDVASESGAEFRLSVPGQTAMKSRRIFGDVWSYRSPHSRNSSNKNIPTHPSSFFMIIIVEMMKTTAGARIIVGELLVYGHAVYSCQSDLGRILLS